MSNSNDIMDSNNNADDLDLSPITKFYANKSVLITGATGFIGKVSELIGIELIMMNNFDRLFTNS